MSFLKTCTPNGGRARWRIKRHQQDGAARVFAQTSLPLRAWRGWVGVLGGLSLIAGTVVMISKADSQIEGVWKLQTFVVRTLKTFYTAVGVILDYKVTQIRNYFRAEEERYRDLAEFHSRSAQKILELCRSNGGICCKMVSRG